MDSSEVEPLKSKKSYNSTLVWSAYCARKNERGHSRPSGILVQLYAYETFVFMYRKQEPVSIVLV